MAALSSAKQTFTPQMSSANFGPRSGKSDAQAECPVYWFEQLRAGQSYREIAKAHGTTPTRVQQMIDLAFLAPDIVRWLAPNLWASPRIGAPAAPCLRTGPNSAGYSPRSDGQTPIAETAIADLGLETGLFGQGCLSAVRVKSRKPLNMRDNNKNTCTYLQLGKWLAGVAGFEPAHGDTKNRCLTTWLHPSVTGGSGWPCT